MVIFVKVRVQIVIFLHDFFSSDNFSADRIKFHTNVAEK